MGKNHKNQRDTTEKEERCSMLPKSHLSCPLFTLIYTKYVVNNVNKQYL